MDLVKDIYFGCEGDFHKALQQLLELQENEDLMKLQEEFNQETNNPRIIQ